MYRMKGRVLVRECRVNSLVREVVFDLERFTQDEAAPSVGDGPKYGVATLRQIAFPRHRGVLVHGSRQEKS